MTRFLMLYRLLFGCISAAILFFGAGGFVVGEVDVTPPAITNLRAENIFGDHAEIKWTTNEPANSLVTYGTTTSAYPFISSSKCVAGDFVTQHCIKFFGLVSSTTYYYVAKSADGAGNVATSTEFSFSSAAKAAAADLPPLAPSSLVASLDPNEIDVNLAWADNSTGETRFKIFWRVLGEGMWQFRAEVPFDTTSYTDLSVSAGTYEYHINACNVKGCSSDSNIATIKVGGGSPPPENATATAPIAPGNVSAVLDEGSADDVKITWSDNSVDEERFDIFWRSKGNVSWIFLKTASVNTISYTHFDRPADTYEYKVNACNKNGCSADSNIARITIAASEATKTISGRVKRSDGTGVFDAIVSARQKQPDGQYIYVSTMTKEFGDYALRLNGGAWEVNVLRATTTVNWAYNDLPQSVFFANDATEESKILNFQVMTTNATVTGKVAYADGTVPPSNTIFVNLQDSSGSVVGSWADSSGSFAIAVSAGTYNVFLWSENKTLALPKVSSVSVASGATADLGTITITKAAKTIQGTVRREDGTAVTDAKIGMFQKEIQSWLATKVDSKGFYSLAVTGGSWEATVHPSETTADWIYRDAAKLVSFAADTVQESKTIDFTVRSTNATIRGRVLKPDGAPAAPNTVFVSVRSAEGVEFGVLTDSTGSFTIRLPDGTYPISAHSNDARLAAPLLPSIFVLPGETKEIGIIYLILRQDHIKGSVTDHGGKGLANIRVSAWRENDAGFAQTVTDGAGSYDLLVTPGTWKVHAIPKDPTANFINPDPPKSVQVLSGTPAVVHFSLLFADAGISGKIVDAAGNLLPDVYGYVELSTFDGASQGTSPGMGAPVEQGSFTFKASGGTYAMRVFLPPDSPYTAGAPTSVTLASGTTVNVRVTVTKNNATIKGSVIGGNNNIVTGVAGTVFATSANGAWQQASVDRTTGTYTLKISSGTWYVKYHVEPSSGYIAAETQKVELFVGQNVTVTKNLPVEKAGATISGQVLKPSGQTLAYAFVAVRKASFAAGADPNQLKTSFVAGAQTDQSGSYTVAVPAGTYFVNVFIPTELGAIAPQEQSVILLDGQTTVLNLALRSADSKISGTIFADDAPYEGGFIWAWSEKGGYRETKSTSLGKFELVVSGADVWHVAAAATVNGEFYKSSEVALALGSANVMYDLHLIRFAPLASPLIRTTDATKPAALASTDGTSVVVPANSLLDQGTVTIKITPSTRVSSQGGTRVVGAAHELEARNEAGQIISNFNSDVTISLPYLDSDISNLGANEDLLIMSFWDETVGTWKNIPSSLVNKADNVVSATVDHFTRFAIVSPADITPPAAPTGVAASALGSGAILISWVNPSSDFSHVKVYRSTVSRALGTVRVAEVIGTTYTDTDVMNGTQYYYTARAVDPAGNESTNVNQASVVAVGTSTQAPTTFGLNEGDLIRGPDGIKVYIINALGYKRHIFNPAVFGMYGHFSWASIKNVSQSSLDSYITSDLYRAPSDPKVYSLEEIDEANGVAIKHHIELTAEEFVARGYNWNQVFVVNAQERDYYGTGEPVR